MLYCQKYRKFVNKDDKQYKIYKQKKKTHNNTRRLQNRTV